MSVETLRHLAAALLDEQAPGHALEAAVDSLYALFVDIAGPPRGNEDTVLESGLGLSPVGAGHCLLDATRTAVLLRGVRDAVTGGRGEVVYAGTGPFAPLAIPLMTLLAPGEARFTLLDLHEESCRSVRALIDHFRLMEFVETVSVVDATSYRHARPIDAAVVEVMQRALSKEAQVEIAANLSAQLSERGVLVPEEISVDLVTAGGETIGRVLTLDSRGCTTSDLVMPRRSDSGSLRYRTRIRASGRHGLAEGESGLTAPELVSDLAEWSEGETIRFVYERGRAPRLRWTRQS